jgi:hypothetical protein
LSLFMQESERTSERASERARARACAHKESGKVSK